MVNRKLITKLRTNQTRLKYFQLLNRSSCCYFVKPLFYTQVRNMSEEWTAPAKIEDLFAKTAGNKFASVNKPTAGARTEKDLEKGDAPFQLHSVDTPNGIKVNILLEELGVEYNAHIINILAGDQFGSGFVAMNPNSKIPSMVDQSNKDAPVNLFESGSILLHLADKHEKFIAPASDVAARADILNWLMWQMGSGPYFGQFGHFYCYAPKDAIAARDYGVSRYGMEVQRCLSVLDMVLDKSTSGFISNWGYSIADIAIWPWVLCLTKFYKAEEFLTLSQYKNVNAWMDLVGKRPAVQKALSVLPFPKS